MTRTDTQRSKHAHLKFTVYLIALFMASLLGARFAGASAGNIYISQSGAGAQSGADCADAKPVSFFNATANWGSGGAQIGPGTTVHLCGTITTELAFHGSGTSGNLIELLFESGASISVPYCDTNACL